MKEIRICVLLVADDYEDAYLVSQQLQRRSFFVEHAGELDSAMEMLRKAEVDLILLDLSLPDSSGTETFYQAHSQAVDIPIVILTSSVEEVLGNELIRQGVEDYLVKGRFDSAMLARTIRHSIERHKMLRTQRQYLNQYRASEARFRDMIEQNADGILVVDEAGTIRFVNPAAGHIFGRSPEHLMGEKFEYPVLPGEAIEIEIPRENGESVLAEVRMMQSHWEGEFVYIASLRDITERKFLEDNLRQAQKMESIGRLAGGIAHDFNNVLSVIMSYSLMGASQYHNEERVGLYLKEIHDAAERAIALTRQLLTFSRLQKIEPEVVDLNALLLEMGDMLRRLIGTDIEFSVILANNLKPVRIDPCQMEQVLVNLVINARDAMPEGGKLIIQTSNVDADQDSGFPRSEPLAQEYVKLSVSDTGVGMDDEEKARVFGPFFTTKGTGTGLGLSTCYGIVAQCGGEITVETEVGRGSEFVIYWPAVRDSEDFESNSRASDNLPAGSETVLLVEDEPALRAATSHVLQELGYSVIEASNGVEALQMLEEQDHKKIDLLFTDLVMPLMGGRPLYENLRSKQPDVKTIFTSGYAESALVHQAIKNENVGLIEKPYTPLALAQAIRKMLDDHV